MRRFTAYEINLLSRYGIDYKSIDDEHIPVEYIIGKAIFCENEFFVNESTLIPRIETEYLIELALNDVCKKEFKDIKYIDIGCGSGSVGLTFAIELTRRNINFEGILSDISDEALKITKKNLHNLKKYINGDINILNSNLLQSIPKNIKFKYIFANLPYIPSDRIYILPVSVKGYEPLSALDGGEDGLKYIRELLNESLKFLEDDGLILFEVDDTHTSKHIEEFKGSWDISIKNDLNGKNRYWLCRKR